MSRPKEPATPPETSSPGADSTVMVAEEVDRTLETATTGPTAEPPADTTAAMPAWDADATLGPPAGNPLPITAPTPAWEVDPQERIAGEPLPDATVPPAAIPTMPTPAWTAPPPAPAGPGGPQAAIPTESVPAWTDPPTVANPAEATLPTTDATTAPTRKKLVPAPEATRLKLDPVADVTGPIGPPGLSKRLKLGLAGFFTLALVFVVWAFGRSDIVADPSRPESITTVKVTAVPIPEKKIDVTPLIAAPKELPKPALTMEVTVDGGSGPTQVSASIVRIETEPPTSVSWNGEDFGWTPALITMPVGPNTVTFENKEVGFKRTVTITAANEERTFLRFEFAKGWLAIDRPRTAKGVFVDGVKAMQSPVLIWEGRHRVEVVFANGQKASKQADVVRGETAELFFDDPLPQE